MPEIFPKQIFVTGIGTDVGKTVVSAVLCKALNAEYWKPVQAGGLDFTDSDFVSSYGVKTHHEVYRLQTPASPHFAAELDKVVITTEDIVLPDTSNRLVVEGAGGVMVPLNDNEVVLDLIMHLNIPVVVVSRNYLGSINHTILTCEMLHAAGAHILGIVFNGKPVEATEKFILNYTGLNFLGRVHEAEEITTSFIKDAALKLKESISYFYGI